MSKRIQLEIHAELRSDAVFGSGYSIPGGEDIAVVQDDAGYPYIPGTAVKGLLRESMENWLVWSGGDAADLRAILGESGWQGTADGRRLSITPLVLQNPPADPADCYGLRTFTSLENGVVKTGTLRTAACVTRGTQFVGTAICDESDVDLIQSALEGIIWAGHQRNRGFGRICFHAEKTKTIENRAALQSARCIRYQLRTETPVLISNLSRSGGNSYETRGLIPGAAVRGMVVSELASRDPAWFEANKAALLSEKTCFLDAVPRKGDLPVLPSLLGFFEDKQQTKFVSVLRDPGGIEGMKRASLGNFCSLEGDTIRYWKSSTGGTTRIQRGKDGGDSKPFQVRYLNAGQLLEGYIVPKDPALAEKISEVLNGSIWVGADRYEGYGRCQVVSLESVEEPDWIRAYGYKTAGEITDKLCLVALSPLAMVDCYGNPCGISETELAARLGVDWVRIDACATTTAEFGGYNRTWKCREPSLLMYDRGSVFSLTCSHAPELTKIREIERTGLGVRAAEGYGQVLFLQPEKYNRLAKKQEVQTVKPAGSGDGAKMRRARQKWIAEQCPQLRAGALSASQVGTIQSICAKAISNGCDLSELEAFLQKNLKDRGAKHSSRFVRIADLIHQVTGQPLGTTIGVEDTACPDSMQARLELLCELMDHSRKEGGSKA